MENEVKAEVTAETQPKPESNNIIIFNIFFLIFKKFYLNN